MVPLRLGGTNPFFAMKQLLFFVALSATLLIGSAFTTEQKAVPSPQNRYGTTTIEEFLALTPNKIQEQTGKKLSLKEVIALKAVQKKVKQAQNPTDDSPKSQLVAVLLAVFVGVLGIHRFYLGYTSIGIIQLLTLGGCGIWALIDLIRIAMGDLKPANGSEYNPKL